jgi:primosomal protein N' (replication factor Y) (superfamily II helicase)
MYAEIAINVPVQTTFHYHVPTALQGTLQPGHMVQVAFRTRAEHGIVIACTEQRPPSLPDNVQTKPIEDLLHPEPVINPAQLALAQWMAARYLSSVAAALALMLPPGFTGGRDIRVILTDPRAAARDMFEHRVINLLQRRGALYGAQISHALAGEKKANWRRTVDALEERGVVRVDQVLKPPRIKPRNVQTAALVISPDEVPTVLPSLGKTNRRADLLEAIAGMGPGPHTLQPLLASLGTTQATLKKMAADDLIRLDDDGVTLAIAPDKLDETLIDLRGAHTQGHVLRVLARENDPIDVSWVYTQTGASLKDLKRLEADGLICLGERTDWRDTTAQRAYDLSVPPSLTPAQSEALAPIIAAQRANQHAAFLLHGVTGSGKTEIYLQAIQQALDDGKTALFLVPEIALTPQTTARVVGRFPGRVTVLHSGLDDGERYDAWRRAREGLVQVVVGARSALFAPLANLGVIVIDEEHDHSYKQSPNVNMPPFRSGPHYDARAAALELARLHQVPVIYGSATPAVEMTHATTRDQITYLTLPQRILAHREQAEAQAQLTGVPLPSVPDSGPLDRDLPPVQVVDMRSELKRGNTSIFSQALQTALAHTLRNGEQAILFLNRRGQNTYVFCRDCGYVVGCPDCDTPLTFHWDGIMRCHRCNHQQPHPKTCAACGSRRIKFFGAGTQQVEKALAAAFPAARVVRWDADTAADPATHSTFLRRFQQHEADVMVGTQMIAKGLDLPLVTLVGIISADTALNLPDFRAGERSFQLLTQVAGRAGRSLLGGRVILQTYQPDHYAVTAAAAHDYETFYQREIDYRRDMGYPPFRQMARILFRYPSEAEAKRQALEAANRLRKRLHDMQMTGTELIGPAPCFFTRIAGHYRWHLLLRGPDPVQALRGMTFDKNWYVDVHPVDVL